MELAHFGRGAVDDVALLLERGDFLGHAVGERLERRELALGLRGLGRGLGQVLEGLTHRRGARLGLTDAPLRIHLPLLKCAKPRCNRLARLAELFLPRPYLIEAVREFADRAAQRVGIHPQGLEPTAQLEEAGDFILERERLLEHAAQLVDLAAQLFCILGVLRELRFGAALRLRDVLGLFVEGREHRHQAPE